MRNIRGWLLTLLLCALAIKVMASVVEPLIPYLIAGVVATLALGFIYYRMFR